MEAKTTCHSGCGCSCGHNKGEEHPNVVLPILSFILLIVGLILDHTGQGWFSPTVKLVWYLAAFLPVGLPVIREAYHEALRKDFFTEFTLMSVASTGAFSIGEYPEAVAVMLFYTVGEMLQNRAVERASQNISRLLDVRPERTDVFREGNYINVSPKEVRTGERIEVKPGGRIPLDGILQETEVSFDTSALTGESMPRILRKGNEVLAGMIVLGQTVRIEVNRPYEQSALARILVLVKDAAERKAPAELFIRRFARFYTPAVIVLALLIVTVPAFTGLMMPSFQYVFHDWLYRGLVFLVISCPCALVISVPLGYFGGIGAASRAGILFKGGNYLDAITRINTIVFDKTGTLTTGCFDVTDIQAHRISESELLTLLLSVEQKSTHPIAQAIVRYAKKQNISAASVSEMHELAGHGVEAVIGGQEVLVGNIRLMKERGISIPEELSDQVATVVICAIDKKYAGHLLLSDTLKDLLPEDKAAHIWEMVEEPGKSVAFVGDGMNDAPVLALSHVGIAMGGLGSDAAIESADVVIQNDQPSKVATAITIGRKTRTIVRQNIIGALVVKGIVLSAGALGYATLWGAVFADVGVALLAVLNSVRILNRKVW